MIDVSDFSSRPANAPRKPSLRINSTITLTVTWGVWMRTRKLRAASSVCVYRNAFRYLSYLASRGRWLCTTT
ncbi:hypothetical protein NP493_261g00013 [Ridgeia piscesae]|uniref:Uncharacterized protein n=1 Tax=Ridgeia piscesae TaxID=27915 RepID=A0AAD9UCN6_RIDPI|nr:hypothetical protein NP493_261g00013 [Ridgeia piscesae]